MFTLKGFISITALANNTPNLVSPLGELSSVSESYAREKGFYNKADAPNVQLVTFTSERDGNVITTPAAFHSHVLTIAQWVFNNAVSNTINDDPEAFRQLLLTQFGVDIKNVEVGKMVVAKSNWMPSYIQWTLDKAGVEENTIRIWFADEAFQNQYDDYEIIVIPPIEPVDTFQKVKSVVQTALATFNQPDHLLKVLEKTDGVPYTYLISKEYDWYDREDPTATLPTTWSVAVYGIAGRNPIVIKEAIADYILENSAYGRPDWIPVFPDIFTSTEFVFVPMWHRNSIPDETVRGSLYSPLVSYNDALAVTNMFVKYTKAGHVQENLEFGTVHFKSLAFTVVGGQDNRNAVFNLSAYFPDYALIPSTSIEFNRMSADTVEWMTMFVRAVITAEEMDEYSYVDVEFSRIERDGNMYIGFSHENVLYLILTRNALLEGLAANAG
jgi:hypothetical protein